MQTTLIINIIIIITTISDSKEIIYPIIMFWKLTSYPYRRNGLHLAFLIHGSYAPLALHQLDI